MTATNQCAEFLVPVFKIRLVLFYAISVPLSIEVGPIKAVSDRCYCLGQITGAQGMLQ